MVFAKVVIGARRADRLQRIANKNEAAGGQVRVRALDVTNHDDVVAFAGFAPASFGRLDVIVNNASVMLLSTSGTV